MDGKDDYTFEISFFESLHKRAPEYTDVIEILGSLYTQSGRYKEGLLMDRKYVSMAPDNPTAHYNLACSLALLGHTSDALCSLQKAVELGYDDAKWMQEDPDLNSLHSQPLFQKLLLLITKN